MPQLDDGLLLPRRCGLHRRRRGRCDGEIDTPAVGRERQFALVADVVARQQSGLADGSQVGRGGQAGLERGQHRYGQASRRGRQQCGASCTCRRFPVTDAHHRPGGGGGGRSRWRRCRRDPVEEDKLHLLFVPGEPAVPAWSAANDHWWRFPRERDSVDTAGLLLAGNGVDEPPAVLGERKLGHVGKGTFLAIGEVANDHLCSLPRLRGTRGSAWGRARHPPALGGAALGGIGDGHAGSTLIDHHGRTFLRHAIALYPLDARHLAVGQGHQPKSVGRRCRLAFTLLGTGGVDGKGDYFAVGREQVLARSAGDGTATASRGGRRHDRAGGKAAARIAIFPAGAEDAGDELTVAFLRRQGIGEHSAVGRKDRPLDRSPGGIVAVLDGSFRGRLRRGRAGHGHEQDTEDKDARQSGGHGRSIGDGGRHPVLGSGRPCGDVVSSWVRVEGRTRPVRGSVNLEIIVKQHVNIRRESPSKARPVALPLLVQTIVRVSYRKSYLYLYSNPGCFIEFFFQIDHELASLGKKRANRI